MNMCVIPRWGANPDDDWYPWLVRELPAHPVSIVRLRPSATAPTVAGCVAELTDALGIEASRLANTVLVGHSVGCLAALHYLQTLPRGARVAAVLCVAGWWWLDQPRPAHRAWLETPILLARAKAASLGGFTALLSESDPYTGDQAANGAAWQRELGAEVRFVAGGGHFKRTREPAVAESLARLLHEQPAPV